MAVFYYLGQAFLFLAWFAAWYAGHYLVSAIRGPIDRRRSVRFALEMTVVLVVFYLAGRFLM